MTTQYLPNLGETPGQNARRDAVHIAVAPLVAGEALRPGERVGLLPDGTAVGSHNIGVKSIGIVDPFLLFHVEKGGKFWLFLYPGTVTSLRHVWTHPAFKPRHLMEECLRDEGLETKPKDEDKEGVVHE